MEKRLKKIISKNEMKYPIHLRNATYFMTQDKNVEKNKLPLKSIQCDDFIAIYPFYKKISLL